MFKKLVEQPFFKKFLPSWNKEYIYRIQKKMVMHRQEMSENFDNRIDYVGLSAFGVGIEEESNPIESQMKDFNQLLCKFQGDGLFIAKLQILDKLLQDIQS